MQCEEMMMANRVLMTMIVSRTEQILDDGCYIVGSDDNEQKTIDNTNKPNEEALFASLTAKLKMKLRALTSGEKVDDDVDEVGR